MSQTSVYTFSENAAVRPVECSRGADLYTASESRRGRVSSDIHVGDDATSVFYTYPESKSVGAFAAVRVGTRDASVVMFLLSESLDSAIALRDALAGAVAFLSEVRK